MGKKEFPRYPVLDLVATGENIRRLRLEHGYSVNDLQEYLGLACLQGIYRWQSGKNMPSTDNLYALSKLWGVSMNDILREQKGA